MSAYPKAYLGTVVESQGKLFDLVAREYPTMDTGDFVGAYMASNTRRAIDGGQAYVATMSAPELWDYFCETEGYALKPGRALTGFAPDWIGEFYAYYQWFYDVPSADVAKEVPLSFLEKAYPGLHDLDLDLAVEKVGAGLHALGRPVL